MAKITPDYLIITSDFYKSCKISTPNEHPSPHIASITTWET